MKTTVKEFNLNNELRKSNRSIVRTCEQLIRDGENTLGTDKEMDKANSILECQKKFILIN